MQVWECNGDEGYESPGAYCCDPNGEGSQCCQTHLNVFTARGASIGNAMAIQTADYEAWTSPWSGTASGMGSATATGTGSPNGTSASSTARGTTGKMGGQPLTPPPLYLLGVDPSMDWDRAGHLLLTD